MPKFYCEYCDLYLTHSGKAGRYQHLTGRRHINNKIEYYQALIREKGLTPPIYPPPPGMVLPMPKLPGAGAPAATPGLPAIPNLPKLGGLGTLPGLAAGGLPALPGGAALPSLPGLPALPGPGAGGLPMPAMAKAS
mmetsp:Transcript_7771/g.17050  ORF Transcript_7771/g.17050 Transcript_7771/m.17050 type:complete len:136 (-) Transcript_7771:94-501(-)|eukprot:CAMPEP_0178446806 /NCGR_PEP_ID=MMETSP0689_2-20121128/41023_1 /TAXON_ID=160604 /ORGANISM="Amphidinium massartii, Strain CS-259" /LENGTH=135 /DNA_ID=CAMNT_0020071701 /DNA_START=131 /DNA_END=538 /DNA_ORIENTATION=+